ncbi:transcriptional activator of ethanol catabolism AlcS [Protomyces lactucae-debilis]|uniref:Transcriptional activator of ethanol catabolism AlcS n=1 Tax=Protomyces lactucae-debilis TaxID=2754530 RepID=A0A1Y2F0J6_PROLT|nr:transcriptional activator of ethanol catabolism AlcS [Protomyces lactucae-debilis]ORY77014.1 transcriptional activator of ethanol catabolism AlcS [Protomyces lactucae-debilis]
MSSNTTPPDFHNAFPTNTMSRDHYKEDPDMLERTRTGSLTLTPEMFERLYLSPKNGSSNGYRKIWGNPTPLGLVGFLLALMPLSCTQMGWRGAGAATVLVGPFISLGGMAMIISGLLEFFLGATFPFVVFITFGGFYLSFATILLPDNGIAASYANAATATDVFNKGNQTVPYLTGLAFYLVWWAVVDFTYLVVSLRTNMCFFGIFLGVFLDLCALSSSYLYLAEGNVEMYERLEKMAGGCGFVTCIIGFYLLWSLMLDTLDFPFSLPIGDLSGLIKGRSMREKMKADMA